MTNIILASLFLLLTSSIALSQDLFKDPNLTSEKMTKIPQGEKLTVLEEKWVVDPGEATIIDKTDQKSIPEAVRGKLTPGAKLKILEYTGEGYSKVEFEGKQFGVEIARSNKNCKKNPKLYWHECWVNVTKEPTYILWKKVKASDSKIGWIISEKLDANHSLHFPGSP